MIISEREFKFDIGPGSALLRLCDIIQASGFSHYRFVEFSEAAMQDSYLDDAARTLARNSSYLRVRGRQDCHLITYRREVKENSGLTIDETTHSLNDAGLNLICQLLRNDGIIPAKPDFIRPFFIYVFESAGLREMVRLSISREQYDIVMDASVVGRIKLDSYSYSDNAVPPGLVLEVAAYKEMFYPLIKDFIRILLEEFPRQATITARSKYQRWHETTSAR